MTSLIKWLICDQKPHITASDEQEIFSSIGVLSGMAQSINEIIGIGVDREIDNANLAFTASLLAEIIGELNSLLQKPPSNVIEC